jgi:hypothetical protein
MPGEEAWLVGERRSNDERKYYLSNLPADARLKTLAAAIKARWVCEQAHRQMKEELGLDHFEGRSCVVWHLIGFCLNSCGGAVASAREAVRRLPETWLRIELRRRQDEDSLSAGESIREPCRIFDGSQGDFTALCRPDCRFCFVKHDGADRLSGSKKSTGNLTANLAGNSSDCEHYDSPNWF